MIPFKKQVDFFDKFAIILLMKIGVFDSGLGGLIIAKALMKALPDYDYVYLGDTQHLPYGEKTSGRILAYTLDAMRYLIEQECGLIIIACNTATAITLRYLQKRFCPSESPQTKILGVIIPAVEEALKTTPEKIAVIATNATIRGDIYKTELNKIAPDLPVFSLATPELVPAIESADFNKAENIIQAYAPRLKDFPALILGCTHYPIIKNIIQKHLPNTRLISQDEFMGQKLTDYLQRHPEIENTLSRQGTRRFCITKESPHFTQVAHQIDPSICLEQVILI